MQTKTIQKRTVLQVQAKPKLLLQSVIVLVFAFIGVILMAKPAAAATRTWDGGGADNNWSSCANWSGDTCPGNLDDTVFNGTSTKASSVDAGFAGTVQSLTINAGYSGTITQARSLTMNYMVQNTGTYNASNQDLTLNYMQINAGTFTAPSTTLNNSGTFELHAAATFNHNSGTINFTAGVNMTCANKTLNYVTFTATSFASIQVGGDCVVPLGSNPTIGQPGGNSYVYLAGTFTGSGKLTVDTSYTGAQYADFVINSTNPLSGFSSLDVGRLSTWPGSVFTPPSGGVTLRGMLLDAGGTFNANGATFNFTGTGASLVFRIGCGGKTLSKAVLEYPAAGEVDIASDCNLPLGTNPTVTIGDSTPGRRLVLSGELSGSGTLTYNGYLLEAMGGSAVSGFTDLVVNGTYDNNGTTDNYSGLNSMDVNGDLIIENNGMFTSTSNTLSVSGRLAVAAGSTFNANSGTVVMDGVDQAISGTMTLHNLTKTVTSADNLGFGMNNTVTVDGVLTLLGTNGQLLGLQGSTDPAHFAIGLVGQPDYSGSNSATTDHNLSYPNGTAIDTVQHRLFIADSDNSRVLVFNLDANNNLIDSTADYVIGQTNFTNSNYAITQTGLGYPVGIVYDADHDRLFVVDSDGNRVLVYDASSLSNGMPASYVLGQSLFTTSGCATSQTQFCYPWGITYDPTTQYVYITDGNTSRVLVFDAGNLSNGMPASYVIGQDNFTASDWATSQTRFKYTQSVAVDSINHRLYVSDGYYANRVLVFDLSALANGMPASYVLGQTNFDTEDSGVSQHNLDYPTAIAAGTNKLFVMDSNNNRLLYFNTTTLANNMDASNLIGQWDFNTQTYGYTTQHDFYLCGDEASFGFDSVFWRIWAMDACNNRELAFDVSSWFETGAQWGIDAAEHIIGYVSVVDSNNLGSSISVENSVNGGNNTNWVFIEPPIPPTPTPSPATARTISTGSEIASASTEITQDTTQSVTGPYYNGPSIQVPQDQPQPAIPPVIWFTVTMFSVAGILGLVFYFFSLLP